MHGNADTDTVSQLLDGAPYALAGSGWWHGAAHLLSQFSVVRYALALLALLYRLCFERPLATLFLRAPRWLGGYAGDSPADICAHLTGVPSVHWLAQQEQCAALMRRRFDTLLVLVHVALYALMLYRLAHYAWYRFVLLPLETRRELVLMRERASLLYEYSRRLCADDARCAPPLTLTHAETEPQQQVKAWGARRALATTAAWFAR